MNDIATMILSGLPFVGNVVNVNVHVVDEYNEPVTNALVQVYTHKRNGDRFARAPQYRILDEHTDALGNARFRYTSVSGYIKCVASADGYYAERDDKQRFASSDSDYSQVILSEHSKSYAFTLRRKRNPTTLYYAKPSLAQKLPKGSGEFGFDLLMYDWVAPYGDGKVADFYVQREETTTNGQRTASCGIVFRGDGNGAYVRKKVKTTSDFETDYEADTNGVYQTYFPVRRFPWPGNPKYTESAIVKEDEYIVMRTRVEKNAKGEIIKAHYSVMLGPVRIDELFDWWIYYFNPTPNDPNLEKDLKRNIDLKYVKKKRRRRPVVWPGQPSQRSNP